MFGKQITYQYDYSRLKSISYPDNPLNNVNYTYGVMGATNNHANRIVMTTSEAGTEERFYGPLGEMTKTIHTIITDETPNEPEIYTTEYQFDTWNRLQHMTYPDSKQLTNLYNSVGLLKKADGLKNGYQYSYLKALEYDEFEQRVFMLRGNNIKSITE